MRKLWPGIAATVVAALYGIAVMGRLPERMPMHWNLHGEVDRWGSRAEGVFMLPAIGLLMVAVLIVAPKIDPRRRNFPMHAGAYWVVANAVMVFLAAVHAVVISQALGYPVDINRVIPSGVGILFMILGNFITRARPNWVFGIRTPWTLSSDLSWRETHRLGGRLFFLAGLTVLLTAIAWPAAVFPVLIVGVLGTALFTMFWSWLIWSRDPEAQRSSGEAS